MDNNCQCKKEEITITKKEYKDKLLKMGFGTVAIMMWGALGIYAKPSLEAFWIVFLILIFEIIKIKCDVRK